MAYRAEIDLSVNNREALKGVTQVEGGINKLVKGVKEFERVFNEALNPKGAVQSRFQLEQERKALTLFKQQNAALENQIKLAAQLGSAYDKLQVKVVGTELRRLERARTSQRALPGAGFSGQRALPAAGQTRGNATSSPFVEAQRVAAAIDKLNAETVKEKARGNNAVSRIADAREKIARAAEGEVSRVTRTAPPGSGPAAGVGSRGTSGERFRAKLEQQVAREISASGKLTRETEELVNTFNKRQDVGDKLIAKGNELVRITNQQVDAAKNQKDKSNKNTKKANKAGKAGKKGQGLLGFNQTATNLSAGAGFPLLFGGGPGSVLGGVGGALLGGFGGSIIGGALGQQIDALGASALKTADALSKPTSNLEALINTLGIAGTKLASDLEVLQKLGLSSVASAAATNQFEEIYGADAARKFEQLNDNFKEFTNGLQTLGVAISTLLAGPFGKLLSSLGNAASEAATASTVGQLEKTLSGDELEQFRKRKAELQKATPGAFGSTTTQPLTAANEQTLFKEFGKNTVETTKTLDVDTQISAEMDRQLLLAQKTTVVEAGRLTNRRDTQAAISSEVKLQSALNNLTKINLNLENEKEKTKRRLLELDQKLAKEQVQQAQLAQQNAVRQAELQIYKDQTNAIIATSKVDNEIYQTRLKTQALEQNATGQYQTKLTAIRQEAKSQEEVLRAKFELRKLDIKELEVKIEEAMLLEAKVEKIKVELALKEKQIQQADTLRRIGVDQYNQQQELNTLLAEQNALRAIQANDPERTLGFAGAGLGFFGDSAKLEADLFQKYNDDIDVFNEKIANAKKNLASLTPDDINDGRADTFRKELDTTEVLLANYARLQPAINAAAVEQQQFNDALAAVTPGVNSLVGGLQEVVAGTKSAEEAFADFLSTIADQLIQTAAVLIAQYIAIGLAKAFAGLSSGGGSSPGIQRALDVTPKTGAAATSALTKFLAPRANGGPVNANTPYIVGERGPELMIPSSQGRIVSNENLRAEMDRSNATQSAMSRSSPAATIDVRYSVERINSVDYVTAGEFQQGMAQAAKQGAIQGEQRAMRTLKNSASTRRSVGF